MHKRSNLPFTPANNVPRRQRAPRTRILLAALACAVLPASLRLEAQPRMADTTMPATDFRLGLYGAYQLTEHNLSLASIPSVLTCSPGFTGTDGSGTAFGAVAHYAFTDIVAAEMRLGYSSSKVRFSTLEDIGNAMEGGKVVSAVSEHSIDAELGMIDVEPRAVFTPFSFPLSIGVGMQIGFIEHSTFTEKETLIEPSAATFAGGHTVRNQKQGDIPDANGHYVAALGALGYDIPLSRRVTFSPEISYHRGLTEIIKDSTWKMSEVRFGASLKFRFGVPSLPVTPPPPPANAALAGTVSASALMSGNVEAPIAKITVEEFLSSQLRPLLNYVFFDESSADIPERYVHLTQPQASRFGMKDLENLDLLPTYYQMLNVVGKRMQENPGATITLTGCNSDEGAEKGMTDLSRRRAEAVRDYLRDAWGVDEARIKIEARDLPAKPSNATDPDGIVENRRVEIASDTPEILEPVFTTDTVRTTNPPTIRFHANSHAVAGMETWRLVATQGPRVLREFKGNGDVPATIDWGMQGEQSSIPRGTQPIEYQLSLLDKGGNVYTTPVSSLAIDQVTVQRKRQEKIADKETNRFSLILFDFGKADVIGANRKIVDFIKGKITPDAKVAFTGYTDRVGDADFNQHLSEDRAAATAKSLGVANAAVSGVGESVQLYNNDLPEGRFYCRVVNVVVEVPVNE
jgi:outer membrane protein OmpA-like peptidoglycan-associated protein